MKLDAAELDAIVNGLVERLVPLLIARLQHELRPAADGDGLVDITDLAGRLGLSTGTIRARVADGTLPAVRVGRRVLFSVPAVLEALQEPPAQ